MVQEQAKDITTLVDDIYDTLANPDKYDWSATDEFGQHLANIIKSRITAKREKPELRMSNFGTNCDRKLWYTINTYEDAEPLTPQVLHKLLYGHFLEAELLFLAKVAGHRVEAQQEEVSIEGIKGHPDAIIDGVLVDVKSASGRAFQKFKFHNLEEDDPFGYIDQLSLYLEALKDDERLKVKGEGAFLAVNKENGEIVLDTYRKRNRDYHKEVEQKHTLLQADVPPNRGFGDVPDGASGNRKLGVECSYCNFKQKCWPNIRTFIYANGPRHLTRVERTPEVPEI